MNIFIGDEYINDNCYNFMLNSKYNNIYRCFYVCNKTFNGGLYKINEILGKKVI